MTHRSSLGRIGPAFVVGAVIIGPGSVTVMSKTGALYGYSMLWLSLLAGALMAGFIALFMRFGIYSDDTFLGLTAKKLGRWYAVLCGLSLFCAGAAFQCGNNLGVTAGMESLFPSIAKIIWPILFTVAAIVFMFSFKNIYRIIEKMMTVFLVGMFLAFLVNLVVARPDLPAALKGAVVPSIPRGVDWVTIGGLVATTFVIAAAFFQSYLVKAKGWKRENLRDAATDTILASVTYTLIGTIIMMTAATILYPHSGNVSFDTMVNQLEGVFGAYAKVIFAIGFWAAAFSSFITNALIAGTLLADGLGIGDTLNSTSAKACATLAMIVGTTAAVAVLNLETETPAPTTTVAQSQPDQAAADNDQPPAGAPKRIDIKVTAIAIGQACSLVAVPLGAIAMVVVLFDRRATKGRPLPPWVMAFVLFGAAVLFGLAVMTYTNIQPQIKELFTGG